LITKPPYATTIIPPGTDCQTMKQKGINSKKTVHAFSWYDVKDNFLGYWVISDNLKSIEEIKFDKEGKMFSVTRACSELNSGNIDELVWE